MSKEEARTRNWLLRAFSEKWIPHYYNEPAPPYPHPCPCKKKKQQTKKTREKSAYDSPAELDNFGVVIADAQRELLHRVC